MPNIYSPAELSALLRAHNLAPLKSLGQNFLIDQNIVEKIAAAAVEPGGNVLEVGPGPGALTLQLARRAGRVVAVEIDRGMLGVLCGDARGAGPCAGAAHGLSKNRPCRDCPGIL